MHVSEPDLTQPDVNDKRPWWTGLNSYQWFVLVVAIFGWLFDTMDQQLFNIARGGAIESLHGEASPFWAGLSTFIFMIGWATGGIIFGVLGDRYGRAKTMTLTILLYSAFTGLSALSVGIWDFCFYRFLTGLGVGGEFAVGVTLVAEVMPQRARSHALAWLQACSAIGNVMAAFVGMALAQLIESNAWRGMFLVGALPALLAVFVMRRLHEPEAWQIMRKRGDVRLGSFRELFGDARWRRNALGGVLLATAGVVGLWGIGFFGFELVRAVFRQTFEAEIIARGEDVAAHAKEIGSRLLFWGAMYGLFFNGGAFFGIHFFRRLAQPLGRRGAFAVCFVAAMLVTAYVFWSLQSFTDVFWMVPIMGFFQLAIFGGYAIYFPELFPTRLRSTGTSFCYNVGRYLAAFGPLTLGFLASRIFGDYGQVMSWRYAGVCMCSFYFLGLAALPFLPETKDKPLPE